MTSCQSYSGSPEKNLKSQRNGIHSVWWGKTQYKGQGESLTTKWETWNESRTCFLSGRPRAYSLSMLPPPWKFPESMLKNTSLSLVACKTFLFIHLLLFSVVVHSSNESLMQLAVRTSGQLITCLSMQLSQSLCQENVFGLRTSRCYGGQTEFKNLPDCFTEDANRRGYMCFDNDVSKVKYIPLRERRWLWICIWPETVFIQSCLVVYSF